MLKREAATMLVDLCEWFEQEGENRETLSVALLSPYVNQSRTLRKEANVVLKKKEDPLEERGGLFD